MRIKNRKFIPLLILLSCLVGCNPSKEENDALTTQNVVETYETNQGDDKAQNALLTEDEEHTKITLTAGEENANATLTTGEENSKAALKADEENTKTALTTGEENSNAALTADEGNTNAALTADEENTNAALTAKEEKSNTALAKEDDSSTASKQGGAASKTALAENETTSKAPIVDAKTNTPSAQDVDNLGKKLQADEGSQKESVTVSISCHTILENKELLDPDKEELVPSDGMILATEEVDFKEGDTVFDVLVKVTKAHKIHMEYTGSSTYNTNYIEGIHNLYEFDCGPLSGWMYKVNGVFPNYGCSSYKLKKGDIIEWVYTCDLGKDVGGGEISQK